MSLYRFDILRYFCTKEWHSWFLQSHDLKSILLFIVYILSLLKRGSPNKSKMDISSCSWHYFPTLETFDLSHHISLLYITACVCKQLICSSAYMSHDLGFNCTFPAEAWLHLYSPVEHNSKHFTLKSFIFVLTAVGEHWDCGWWYIYLFCWALTSECTWHE